VIGGGMPPPYIGIADINNNFQIYVQEIIFKGKLVFFF
jgi:hypothetical protein